MFVYVLTADAVFDAHGDCIENSYVVGVFAREADAQVALSEIKLSYMRPEHGCYTIGKHELK